MPIQGDTLTSSGGRKATLPLAKEVREQKRAEAQQKTIEQMKQRIEALKVVQTERLVLADNAKRRRGRQKRWVASQRLKQPEI